MLIRSEKNEWGATRETREKRWTTFLQLPTISDADTDADADFSNGGFCDVSAPGRHFGPLAALQKRRSKVNAAALATLRNAAPATRRGRGADAAATTIKKQLN